VGEGSVRGENTFGFTGKIANFRTMTDSETSRNFDYDYSSIMHYGPYFFRCPSLLPSS
jgi:hypothetical protein